ncbi:HPr family phosphocarrier protein [Nocardia donostiensis]|uniref:Uncharacterized protein n=1 Tax=Nocardia donostiensis TaxID=1538463 RepID=A0A1V2TGN5_9NOCA|nr:HPr family phosphocarrier protein [Nocardia donostiensis]ONM48682.1 hypothetical protein B0T46_11655 [Nocardia donostiensis]OQS17580.1 hypothetical protein B0T44_24100 [Nocardia donostiensis]
MYFEEFPSPGALTADTAASLADTAGKFSSYLTITANDHSVNAPVLPWCWAELGIQAGTPVIVTTDRGHRPTGLEDRRALAAFVSRYRELTAPPE